MGFSKVIKQNHYYFYIGLFLKLVLSAFFISATAKELLLPFIDYFVDSGFQNPYAHFLAKGELNKFPYPAAMLYIMMLPKLLFSYFDFGINDYFELFIYRLPLLIADLTIFFILKSWLKGRYSRLIWLYWFSPVLIYINYIYGQFDAIPIAVLFLSLYFLFKDKVLWAAFFLGLAAATKTHIFLVVGFFFLYLYFESISVKRFFLFFLIFVFAFLLPNSFYLFDPSFLEMVFLNQEQNKIFNASFSFREVSFYLVPASLFLLFIKGILIKHYNKDIFIMFLGFSFGIILLFIPPMQGWYFWLIPFLVYFYSKSDDNSFLLLIALQFFYISYFIFSDHFDLFMPFLSLEVDPSRITNIIFTFLQVTLFTNCLWIYKKGLESYSRHKIISSPFLIGIAGDSGVGKSTISDALSQIFLLKNTTILRGDDMHKWQRGDKKWEEYTHLNPKANYLHKEIDMLKKLKRRKKIYRSHYDHNTGTFTAKKMLKSNNIVIFEGLHSFYIAAQRNLFDLKIFIKPEQQLVYHWKIVRDTLKRGYSKEKILEQLKKREKDSKIYIEKQAQYADILVQPTATKRIRSIGSLKEKVDVFFKVYFSNSVYLEFFLEALSHVKTLHLKHDYLENDKQMLEICGKIPANEIEVLADKLIPALKEIGVNKPSFQSDAFGVLTLLLTYYIFEVADNEA